MIMETIKKLQNEAVQFLTKSKIVLKGIDILPKEIEVYYYEVNGSFKDCSVHKNKKQMNNKNHFYVHRKGTEESNLYIGGTRGCLDFVVSDNENVFYSYLIRSAVINGEIVVGPNNVLRKILEVSNLEKSDLENTLLELKSYDNPNDILFSKRIGLGKKANNYIDCPLRAIVCDEFYSRYKGKEKIMIEFLSNSIKLQEITKAQAFKYAKEKLGYELSIFK